MTRLTTHLCTAMFVHLELRCPVKSRREFVKTALAGSAATCVYGMRAMNASAIGRAVGAPTADSRIEILLDEPQGTIPPNIYGHFAEHLGGVIYDGLWVGPTSKVPNVDGLRHDVIEHMKKIKAPVVRYPGGCFADSYVGATELVRARSGRGVRISGTARTRRNHQRTTGMSRMNWAPTSSYISAS